ncbi:putative Blue copper protein [Melia azedarach]|uniref:Blue copper protein n=1 Tax=Melia azedarach TaxID=155640 RepID=A0ACC1XPV6_MELAZ|nr:putative Blue copper protein [Melia azedarach]
MASLKLFIVLVIVAITFPSILATDHIVGDETGWTINFDYKAWAQGKVFRVGDRLIFNYEQGAHNVIRADGASFQQCAKPNGVEALTTGSDVITLATPGRKWYFCGVGKHCEVGNQKLAITVLAAEGESPASAPSPSANTPPSAATARTASVFYGMMAVVLAFAAVVMV